MAYITIKTKTDEGLITLQERVVPSDMVSEFFCAHLVERLRWAIEDAHVTPSLAELDGENATDRPGRTSRPRDMPFGACPRALTPRSAEKRFRLSRAIRFSPCTAIGSFLVAGSAPLAADHASRLISYTSGSPSPDSRSNQERIRTSSHGGEQIGTRSLRGMKPPMPPSDSNPTGKEADGASDHRDREPR